MAALAPDDEPDCCDLLEDQNGLTFNPGYCSHLALAASA